MSSKNRTDLRFSDQNFFSHESPCLQLSNASNRLEKAFRNQKLHSTKDTAISRFVGFSAGLLILGFQAKSGHFSFFTTL